MGRRHRDRTPPRHPSAALTSFVRRRSHVEAELRRHLEAARVDAEIPAFAGLGAFGGDGWNQPVSDILRTSCGLNKIHLGTSCGAAALGWRLVDALATSPTKHEADPDEMASTPSRHPVRATPTNRSQPNLVHRRSTAPSPSATSRHPAQESGDRHDSKRRPTT